MRWEKGFVDEVQAEVEGLIAHEKTKRKRFDRSHQDFECYYCYKKWHIKVNCPKFKEKHGNVKSSDAASIIEEDLYDDMVLSVTIGNTGF